MARTSKPTNGASDQPKPKRAPARKPNGAANGDAMVDQLNNGENVARRAYEIYESRGGRRGSDVDHWLEAERELRPGATSVTGSIGVAKPKKTKKAPEAGA